MRRSGPIDSRFAVRTFAGAMDGVAPGEVSRRGGDGVRRPARRSVQAQHWTLPQFVSRQVPSSCGAGCFGAGRGEVTNDSTARPATSSRLSLRIAVSRVHGFPPARVAGSAR